MARKLAKAFILNLGLGLPLAASALGLGVIESDSVLNEPLSAKIPLRASPEELESLNISLAPSEAFEKAGVDRPFSLAKLKFELVTDAGQPFVKVTTREPVKDPFLNFLVEARWATGRLLREYTVLLDPPVYAPRQQAPVVSQQAPAPAREAAPSRQQTAQQDAPSSRLSTARPTVSRDADVRAGAGSGAAGEYGPVKANETLWEIAQRVRPNDSVSLNQTMLALLRANPGAFIDGDMNKLKRGSVLRVPSADDISSVSATEARGEVNRAIAEWRSGQGGGQQTAARVEVVAPEDTGGESTAADAVEGGDDEAVNELRARLQVTEAQNESLQAENQDLKAQVEAMRRELASRESAVNVDAGGVPVATEDDEGTTEGMAATTEQPASDSMDEMAGEEDMADESATVTASGEQPSDAGQAPVDTAEAETTDESEMAGEQTAADDQAPAEPETGTAQTEPEEQPEPVVAEEPEPKALDPMALLQNRNVQIGVGAGALVLLLVLMLIMRKRRAAQAADDSEMPAESVDAFGQNEAEARGESFDESEEDLDEDLASSFDAEASASEDEFDLGGELDQEQEDFMTAADEEAPSLESDALSEAEVYLAYGRYDQAKDVVEKATESEPNRKDLRLKLMEIQALLQDRDGFISQAEALKGLVSGDEDPDWRRAAEMGGDFVPDHPLFGGAGAPAAAEDEDLSFDLNDVDESVDVASGVEAVEEDAEAFDLGAEETTSEAAGEDELSFDLDDDAEGDHSAVEDALKAGSEAPAAAEDDLEFDLSEPEVSTTAESDDGALEFDMPGVGEEVAADEEEMPSGMDAAPDMTSEDEDEDALPDSSDEVETKLDLAKAYLDMGDTEGAESLLNEVLAEGNGGQKDEAQKLLSEIA